MQQQPSNPGISGRTNAISGVYIPAKKTHGFVFGFGLFTRNLLAVHGLAQNGPLLPNTQPRRKKKNT